jgi:hypothetical protein
MRITARQLRRIINEESRRIFLEQREELPDVKEDRECEELGERTHKQSKMLADFISKGAVDEVTNLKVNLNLPLPPKDPCSYGVSFDFRGYLWTLYVAKP